MKKTIGKPQKKSYESKKKYDIQYAKENYHRVPLNLKKEFYEEIKRCINDVPVNTFVKCAIREKLDRDLHKQSLCAGYVVYENNSDEKHLIAVCKDKKLAEKIVSFSTEYFYEAIEPVMVPISKL